MPEPESVCDKLYVILYKILTELYLDESRLRQTKSGSDRGRRDDGSAKLERDMLREQSGAEAEGCYPLYFLLCGQPD